MSVDDEDFEDLRPTEVEAGPSMPFLNPNASPKASGWPSHATVFLLFESLADT